MTEGALPAFTIEPLGAQHDRKGFCCGVAELDHYLRSQASQDMRRRVATVFVLRDMATERLAGFYTLSATGILLPDFPDDLVRKLPRYPIIPATLLGRLAVSERYRGQRLGELLLYDALERTRIHAAGVASFALVADAKNDAARDFYLRYGFVSFPGRPQRLFLPL